MVANHRRVPKRGYRSYIRGKTLYCLENFFFWTPWGAKKGGEDPPLRGRVKRKRQHLGGKGFIVKGGYPPKGERGETEVNPLKMG